MKPHLTLCLVVTVPILWAILSVTLSGHAPIELKAHPAVCMAPCDVLVRVRVEPHPLNRWWVIQLDGPMFQSGMRQLEGEASAATQPEVWFKDLVAGEYVLIAVVYRQQKRSEAGRAVATVSVKGSEL